MRDRGRVLAWVSSLGAMILVLVVVGVHGALALWSLHPLLSVLALAGLAVIAALSAMAFARVLRAPDLEYAPLLGELRRAKGQRLATGRLRDLRAWLDAVDARQPRLPRQVILGRILRTVPVLVALVALGGAIWMAADGALEWGRALLVAIAPVVSLVLAVLGARSALARSLAIHAVRQKQRSEAVERLEELERRAPAKVAGLTERVSRALSILREQQGQEHKR